MQKKDFDDSMWQQTLRQVQGLTDKLGMGVDGEIAETVTAMRLIGLTTRMSCGGHLDRITGGPYVTFIAQGAEVYRKKCAAIANPKDMQYKEFVEKAFVENLNEQAKLYALLERFYEKRPTPFLQRLTLRTMGFSTFKLDCQGADLAYISSPLAREELLEGHRREMREFTEFLKDAISD